MVMQSVQVVLYSFIKSHLLWHSRIMEDSCDWLKILLKLNGILC